MTQEISTVIMKVISQKGTCVAGHKVGDEFETSGTTPAGLCLFAFSSLLPTLTPLMFGGQFFWSKDKDAAEAVCPDAANPVVFELRRIRKT